MNLPSFKLFWYFMRPHTLCELFTLYGGGGKGGSPNYTGAAEKTAEASKEATTSATWANRPTLNTPWGQQTWESSKAIDPSTGQPVTSWTGNVTLNPAEQAAKDAQDRIQSGRSSAAEGLLGQATAGFEKPVDWSALPKAPGSLEEAQQGAFTRMSAELQPGRQQKEQALDTQLSNMGLPRGSEAWNREKMRLSGEFAQQDKGLLSQAGAEGRADVGTQTGMRQAAIQEEATRRGMSLNELNALLTGQQVGMPAGMGAAPNTTAGAAQGANYNQAASGQGQYNMGSGTDWGSLVGTGAVTAGMFM